MGNLTHNRCRREECPLRSYRGRFRELCARAGLISGSAIDPSIRRTFFAAAGSIVGDPGDGYVEVLLTPGAFLRVGPNSELSLSAVGLADTRINLSRGNALVEVDQLISGTHLEVTIAQHRWT